MEAFQISSGPAERGEGARIIVDGELDAYRGAELRAAFEAHFAAGENPEELDVSGVRFMDSGGLRVVLEADERLRDAGVRLRLVDPSPPVLRLLRHVGLHGHFTES